MLGVRYAVAGAIGGYQRWISPYKGFHCAHWTLHRGESCSAFGKRMVVEHGLLGFFRNMRARLADCRGAAQALQARRDLLICLATDAGPIEDAKGGDEADDGEDKPTGKDAKRSSSAWMWADCLSIPDCGSLPSCDFDIPSCDCSW